jgi:hypothetical protein
MRPIGGLTIPRHMQAYQLAAMLRGRCGDRGAIYLGNADFVHSGSIQEGVDAKRWQRRR